MQKLAIPSSPPAPSPRKRARACSRLSSCQAEGAESWSPGQGAAHKAPICRMPSILPVAPVHHRTARTRRLQHNRGLRDISVPGKQSAAPQRLQCDAGITAALNFCPMEHGISSRKIRLRLLGNLRIGIHTSYFPLTKAQQQKLR